MLPFFVAVFFFLSKVTSMPPKANKVLKDIWSEEGGTKAIDRPQSVKTSKTWDLPAEVLPTNPLAPRRRKYEHEKPNLRAAVPIPHGGQSYNPQFDEHQAAIATAVIKLEKKKKDHEKIVRLLSAGRNDGIHGNFSADKTWEEEVQDQQPPKEKKAKVENPEKKKKKKKKAGKKATADLAKKAMLHRKHPDREAAVKQLDAIAEIAKEVQKKVDKRDRTAVQKKIARKEGQQIKSFGRYHHTPLALDVTPSDKIVGSLRHMSGGYVHPALERIKSLEERNIIPARMRHTFNKRKMLKPKGDVRLKTEDFGPMPETSH